MTIPIATKTTIAACIQIQVRGMHDKGICMPTMV